MVSLNTISTELQGGGYGDRLLAAVFAFEEEGRPLYFIYNFKRGTYYPFVPKGKQERDSERELRIKAQLGARAALGRGHGALVPALGDPALGADSPPRLPRSVEAHIPLARPLTAGWAVTPQGPIIKEMNPISYVQNATPRTSVEPSLGNASSRCPGCATDWLRPTGAPLQRAARCIRCDCWLEPQA